MAEAKTELNEKGLLFALYGAGHIYIILWSLARWFVFGDSAFMAFPLALVALGGVVDNYRLLRGALLGEAGLSTSLTSLSYLFHIAGLPLLWITLSDILGNMFDQGWISVIGRVMAVTLCVYGFNELMISVMGNYKVTDEGDVWRYRLDPAKNSWKLMAPALVIAICGLFIGFFSWIVLDNQLSFWIQFYCILGWLAAPNDTKWGIYLSNFLDVVFLSDLVYIQFLVS